MTRFRLPPVVPYVLIFGHERRHIDPKSSPELFKIDEADVPLAALDVAHIARMKTRSLGQPFLCQATGEPEGPKGLTEGRERG